LSQQPLNIMDLPLIKSLLLVTQTAANIAASLLLLRPEVLSAAVLFPGHGSVNSRHTTKIFLPFVYGLAGEPMIQLFRHLKARAWLNFCAAPERMSPIRFARAGHGIGQ